MSNKERIMQLIEDVPDGKLVFIINMLESLKSYAGEEIAPDEWGLFFAVLNNNCAYHFPKN